MRLSVTLVCSHVVSVLPYVNVYEGIVCGECADGYGLSHNEW